MLHTLRKEGESFHGARPERSMAGQSSRGVSVEGIDRMLSIECLVPVTSSENPSRKKMCIDNVGKLRDGYFYQGGLGVGIVRDQGRLTEKSLQVTTEAGKHLRKHEKPVFKPPYCNQVTI